MSSAPNSSHSFHLITPSITVIERGWLNCNQILLTSARESILIDSGYCTALSTRIATAITWAVIGR
jgi:hypothetical protein